MKSPTSLRKASELRGEFYVWYFCKKPDAKLEKGLRGFVLVALMSVLSKWLCAGVGGTRARGTRADWNELHVSAERSVSCEHLQALLTNIPLRHWEWQEDRRDTWVPEFFRYRTAFVANLDVNTAFRCGQALCSVSKFDPHRTARARCGSIFWRR